MATPSANHYMRQYTTEQLRTIVGDPRHYGVGERLDADAILRERAAPAVISRDPLACRVRWHGVGCVVESLSDGSYRHTGETAR